MFQRVAALTLLLAFASIPALAERPIVDLHRLDAYFALFASDSNVPWKSTTVRLDTYSSAPVRFTVYQVDPADVITAGSNERPRAIDTRGRRATSSFSFTPPGGYEFQSNEVDVQLGSREGFFVVEARRGDVGEQVWINRTRVGLVSKETPNELVLYGTDLGSGRGLPKMRVQVLVNGALVTSATDDHGILRWGRQSRPVFALAQWGDSYAFLSLLPQAPLPATIVAIRSDSAVVHAGDTVRLAGFARTRQGSVLRATTGSATVSLRLGATLAGQQTVSLDAAGAFSASIPVPADAPAGDYAALAQVDGGVGGATVHVDANAGGLSLEVSAQCSPCDARADVPLLVKSSRGDAIVHVKVVRSPHVYVGYVPNGIPWATTTWVDQTVRTGADGTATVSIPHPNDELGSTYGVRVDSGGATADTRFVVPTSRAAIRIVLDREEQTLGTPVGFDVYANDVGSGKPLAGATVTAQLVHGNAVSEQKLNLDGDGHARGSFSSPPLGTNLIFARVDSGGVAMDAAQVQIETQAGAVAAESGSANVRIDLDKPTYASDDTVAVQAGAPGSAGDALITLESALGAQASVTPVADGRASAHLRAADATGELRIGAAFVRDGAIEWTTVPLGLDAPGRPVTRSLALEHPDFSPGESANVSFRDAAAGGATMVVRISRGAPSGSALFDTAPGLLAIGLAATQTSAPDGVTWHPWVDSTGDHAQVLGFVRRTQPPQEVSLAEAATQDVSWSVQRATAGVVAVQMPAASGRYTLSVLEISDDGRVSAASSSITVR
jgi:hypothetical protein